MKDLEPNTAPNTSDLATVAERLRVVKAAQRQFLRLWGIEQAMINPLLDRMAVDLAKAEASPPPDLPAGPEFTDVSGPAADGGWIAGEGWSMNG
jgi:hypothetical protein